MKNKKLLGLIILLMGVVMLFTAEYIKGEVNQGKGKISSAEKKVKQGEKFLSVTPATKELGKALTQGANTKIRSAKEEVAYYENLANQIQVGGFLIIGVGVIFLIWALNKKRRP